MAALAAALAVVGFSAAFGGLTPDLGAEASAYLSAILDIIRSGAGQTLAAISAVDLAALGRAGRDAMRHPVFGRPLRRAGATPTSHMRGFWGLLFAYWFSERWVEAWTLTIGVFTLTTILSKSSVWAATASADFLDALVRFHAPSEGVDPLSILTLATLAFAAIHLGRIGGVGIRHFVSTTLHRKARGWTQSQFTSSLLARNHIAMGLTGERDETAGIRPNTPDNIDQRIDECTDGVFAGAIGLAMGIWGSVASIYFISVAVIERSVEVAFLERWSADAAAFVTRAFGPDLGAAVAVSPGAYGSAVLVFLLICLYVPLGTWLAWRIGKVLERQTQVRQMRDASWRGEMNSMLGRSLQLAISHGHRVQQRTNGRLYSAVDRMWHKLNVTRVKMLVFTNGYNFLTNRLVGYMPALPAYLAGGMTFRNFAATSELAAELINDCSWFVQVMPAIATLRANARRLTELADSIERAGDQTSFYRRTGRHDFTRATQDPALGLTLRDLELHHRGHETTPFLRIDRLDIRPGEWVYVRGENGCGKSSLLKTIAGVWPYGSGEIFTPEGETVFFAGQDPDIPERLTLKDLATYPDYADRHSDVEVAAALAEAGLGAFIRELHEDLHDGAPWRAVFSGGQRQRLVLARIILHRPGLLLLDEACAALDYEAVVEFHRLLRAHCPNAVVLSIMHDPEPPLRPDGGHVYNRLLLIEDGAAALHPIEKALQRRLRIAAE